MHRVRSYTQQNALIHIEEILYFFSLYLSVPHYERNSSSNHLYILLFPNHSPPKSQLRNYVTFQCYMSYDVQPLLTHPRKLLRYP